MPQSKEKDPINIFYMVKKIYPMCIKPQPAYYIFMQAASIFHALSIGISVIATQRFFDSVYDASTGKNTFQYVIVSAILLVGFKLSGDIWQSIHNFTQNVQSERILGYMNQEINRKSALINPVEYENPNRLDDINKAINGAKGAINFHIITSVVITWYLTYFLVMGFYLYNLKPTLIFSLLFVFIPVFAAHFLRSKIFSKLEDKSAPLRREYDAYIEAATGKNFYKETKSLGSFRYLKNLLTNTIDLLNAAIWGSNKRSALIDLFFHTLSFLGYGGILFMLVKYLLNGEISVGMFAAVYGSIGMLFRYMENLIGGRIGAIANEFGQIRNFLRFLEIPTDKKPDMHISNKDGITVQNANFKYPNANKYSLKDINLSIKPGETIAIVGENGSGKTTLIKLLIGLYNPTKGSVSFGDMDVNTVSYNSLFKHVSGVFQNFQRYAFSLKENIQIADFNDMSGNSIIERILEENHIDKDNKETFPDGLNTILSREFDGVDISGGQWQRVAIARGFYRKSDIIVLDEPTASIDPMEESAIYKRFVTIAKNKTTIIVTHRMGSARIANRIVVMKDGEIAEIGNHDELIKNGGVYADMYNAQAVWYN